MQKTIKLEPTDKHPVPYSEKAETPGNFAGKLSAAAETAKLIKQVGLVPELDHKEMEEAKTLLDEVFGKKKTKPLTNLPVALGTASFLETYGSQLALDVVRIRAALTTKLLEIANCGDPKHELRAIELLGKHSDIGLFTERSEVTIKYDDPVQLENAIKERIKRILNADISDKPPLGVDLEKELGILDADYEEIDATDIA